MKTLLSTLAGLLFVTCGLAQSDFSSYQKRVLDREQSFESFKASIVSRWGRYEESTIKSRFDYSQDGRTRQQINFSDDTPEDGFVEFAIVDVKNSGEAQKRLLDKLGEALSEQAGEIPILEDQVLLDGRTLQKQLGRKEQQKLKNEYLDTIRGYELQVAKGENYIKRHRQRIVDLFHENLPDVALNLDNIDISSNKLQIDKIQGSLERIGPVNMAVADEFEKESDRYDFLTQQFADLEESDKTINETIAKLDDEAQLKFIDTFKEIQKNFTKTYSSFFEGGEGQLRLVDDNDPLETEIEIIAQPPGKKTQTLRMLSAGEKALTAIALLFAIYLVKPSPFCILDEVDAPLDDTNIAKFAKVLKEFSNKTQFIVVTHNKLTMEKADYMYGVTQAEEGVSKIVSVKFSSEKVKEYV